ncbi:Oidioi.mRNA.OKI2018_I69.PAR.g11576.t1.cds [Oikopleura dioica]|uniref:Oidioi.mRNA.OKI2018_I69.PAR.g11576.t1.cds n=1 Tax=Oikopleura dioica TaxID=34765 RepID=A0ABN7S365_OIKDI|nr:Oidioi.mRNA.OKI2018_I69.PAR.g11576.t1.cds [Oikopleura dioica]
MVSFADDNWFRGLICSLAAFAMIMIGYASYYGFLKSRWPDFDAYYDGEDEEFEANQKKIESYKSQAESETASTQDQCIEEKEKESINEHAF